MKKYGLFIALLTTFSSKASVKTESSLDRIKPVMYSLAASLQGFYRKDIFSKDQYEQYMRLIQELDPVIYEKLRTYEQEFKQHAFLKAVDREPTVLIPKKETHGYPMMILPSLLDQPKEKQKEHLAHFLESYNALEHSQFYQRQIDAETEALNDWASYTFYDKCTYYVDIIKKKVGIRSKSFHGSEISENDPIPFPKDQYEQYMRVIKKNDPVVYDELKKYELTFSEPALLKAQLPTDKPIREKNGFPVIVLFLTGNDSTESKKFELETKITIFYKPFMPLKERLIVLELIKSLAPELHQELIAIDPTGKNHLSFDSDPINASATYSVRDGLPQLTLGKKLFEVSQEELLFILGHELGHYVLGHCKHSTPPRHSGLKSEKSVPTSLAKESSLATPLDDFEKNILPCMQ